MLHPDVHVTVTVNVARSEDEAERQAKGEDVIASAAEEDRALADAQAAALFQEEGAEPDELAEAADEAGEDETASEASDTPQS